MSLQEYAQVTHIFRRTRTAWFSRSRKIRFAFAVIGILILITAGTAVSKAQEEQQTIVIYPSKVTAVGWQGAGNAVDKDLPADAPLSDFSAGNSAFLNLPKGLVRSLPSAPTDSSPDAPAANGGIRFGGQTPVRLLTLPIVPRAGASASGASAPLPSASTAASSSGTSSDATASSTDGTDIFDGSAAGNVLPAFPFFDASGTPVMPELLPSDTSAAATSTVSLLDMLAPRVALAADAASAGPADGGSSVLCDQGATGCSSIEFSRFDIGTLAGDVANVELRLSMAYDSDSATTSPDADALRVEYFSGGAWHSAGQMRVAGQASNATNGGYFLLALPALSWKDIGNLKLRIEYLRAANARSAVYLDGVWLEVAYGESHADLAAQPLSMQNAQSDYNKRLSVRGDFQGYELPSFQFQFEKPQSQIPGASLIASLFGFDKQGQFTVEQVELVNARGEIVPFQFKVVYGDGNDWQLKITKKPDEFLPGKYYLRIKIDDNGTNYVDQQEFSWGLLALNFNKTYYQTGDEGYFQAGVLSDNGDTVCDARLELGLAKPDGTTDRIDMVPSGQCRGNNVVSVPDYSARTILDQAGTYDATLYLLDDAGRVLHYTQDSFTVADDPAFSVERVAPTRIFPIANYPVSITIGSKQGFTGEVVETLPKGFKVVSDTRPLKQMPDGTQQKIWDVSIPPGATTTISYTFLAPDISPYLFTIGPLELIAKDTNLTVFGESRAWQIASDATGNMILFWDGTGAIPTGWTCVSCNATDTFFQKFFRGDLTFATSSSFGTTTVTPTATAVVDQTTDPAVGATNANNQTSDENHTHTLAGGATTTFSSQSILPSYRDLRIIRSNTSGEPATLPTGAIAIFDTTVPAGWTRYSAEDGFFIRGSNSPGATGGSNTVSYNIHTTLDAASTAGDHRHNNGAAINVAASGHTHNVDATTTAVDHEPPYIGVVLGQLNATSSAPQRIIALWDNSLPAGWVFESDNGGDFFHTFPEATTTYGTTGGAATHHLSDFSVQSGPPNTTDTVRTTGSTVASDTHTHTVTFHFSPADYTNIPPYVQVIVAKKTSEIEAQSHYHWRNDDGSETTATAAAPEDTGLTNVVVGTIKRLRFAVTNGGPVTSGTLDLRLEYATATTGPWSAVPTTSGAPWQIVNSPNFNDGDDTTNIATSTGGVDDPNLSFLTPNGGMKDTSNQTGDIVLTSTQFAEVEYALEPTTNTVASTTYYFRLSNQGLDLNTYSVYATATVASSLVQTSYRWFNNQSTYAVNTQLVQINIPLNSLTATVTAPTSFTAVSTSSTIVMLDSVSQHAMGATAATQQVPDDITARVSLFDGSTLVATRNRSGTRADTVWVLLIQYTGPPGGRDEFIVRDSRAINWPGTNLTTAYGPISSVSSTTKVVVFSGGASNPSTNNGGYDIADAIATFNTGTKNVNLTRGVTGNAVSQFQVVEFTGSNWKIQSGTASPSQSPGSTSVTINAVSSLTDAFPYYTFDESSGQGDERSFRAWLASTTDLELQDDNTATANHTLQWYVLENPDMNVQTGVGAADFGTLTTASITLTNPVTNFARSFAIMTGLAHLNSNNHPQDMWQTALTSTTTISLQRGWAGATLDWRYHAVEFTDGVDVNSPMGDINTPVTLATRGTPFHLRLLIESASSTVPAGLNAYKLQFAQKVGTCDTSFVGESYMDMDTASGTLIYADLPAFVDGAPIEANANDPTDGTNLVVPQTFEESNNFTALNDRAAGTDGEWDFSITDNGASPGEAFCLRAVKSDGSLLDNYQNIPEVDANGPPTLSNLLINGGNPISLTEGTTTNISLTATATAPAGFSHLVVASAEAVFYRSGVTVSCTPDNNNCYQATSCTLTGCSGTSCTLTCTAPFWYFAQPTDIGDFAAENWLASTTISDDLNQFATGIAPPVELNTLLAAGVATNTGSIAYGSLLPGADTGSVNATTTLSNTGNATITPEVASSVDLKLGAAKIAASNQKYATSTFTYATGGTPLATTSASIGVTIAKATTTAGSATTSVFWGLGLPTSGVPTGAYTGTNLFTAVGG